MISHRITRADDPFLLPFWVIYTTSFPEVEQRTFGDHKLALADPDFHCRVFLDEGNLVQGLLCFWNLEGLCYIEHFAMASSLRGGGHGSRILKDFARELEEAPHKRLLMLEIDPVEDEISRRRLGFYQRLGYVLNEKVYVHPPYQHRHEPYNLLLLSLYRLMSAGERSSFEDQVNVRVMRYAMGNEG